MFWVGEWFKSSNPSVTVFPYNGYMRMKYSRNINCYLLNSLWKQPTFRDATAGFTTTSSLMNERRNFTMMTRHYKDLQPIRSSTHGHIWVVKCHHNGISALLFVTPHTPSADNLAERSQFVGCFHRLFSYDYNSLAQWLLTDIPKVSSVANMFVSTSLMWNYAQSNWC